MPLIQPNIGGGSSAAGLGPSVPAGARGGFGTALSGLAGVAGSVFERLQERQEQDDLQASRLIQIQKKGEYRLAVDKALSDNDPTSPDYMERVSEALTSQRSAAMTDTGISHEGVLDELEVDLADLEQGALLAAQTGRRGAIQAKTLATAQDAAQRALEMIRDDPDASAFHVADFGKTVATIAPGMDPAQLAAFSAEFADDALEAQVDGLVAGARFGEARQLVDELGGEISGQTRRGLMGIIAGAENLHQNDVLASTQRAMADISIAISDATTVAQLDQIRMGDVEAADQTGLYEGREQARASHIAAINDKRASLIGRGKDLSRAIIAAASGPLTQKEADDYWPEVAKATTQENFIPVLSQFAHDHGQLPTEIKQRLAAAEQTEDAAVLASAAEVRRSVDGAAPNVIPSTKDNFRTQAVNLFVDMGMAPQEAAQRVLSRAPDPATVEQRQKVYDDTHAAEGEDILDDLDIAPDVSWWFGRGYDLEGPALAEAESFRRQTFTLTGDVDVANRMTSQAMQRRWGVTTAGGQPSFQKFPPERHFPPETIPDTSVAGGRAGLPEETRAKIMDELVNGRLDAAGWPARENYTLVPTENAERRLLEGGQPEYYVFLPGPFGGGDIVQAIEELSNGERSPLVVRTPANAEEMASSPTWSAHIAQERKAHDVARERRQGRNIGHPFVRPQSPER